MAVVLLVGVALTGCAGTGPAPEPAEFPLHAVDQQFDLHWRLIQGADLTGAAGRVVRRHADISDVWLQLVGLDAAGRIVSFSGAVHVRWASPWAGEAFTITLRPRGGEQRFEVRVKSFAYEEGAPTKG